MSAPATRPRRPNFFIIGAPKCGTTSLYEYLKGHPDVFMSVPKEPGYFAPDNVHASAHELRFGRDAALYDALFADAGRARRRGEGTVGYIYSEQAPRLIHDFEPQARIIAMVRDPVEMIHSLHNQRLSDGREEITDFGQAIEPELSRVSEAGEEGASRAGRPGRVPLLDRALFSRYIPRWYDTFGRDQVHVIVLEDMERDPVGEFRRVLDFLELDPDYQPEAFAVYNVRHQPRSNIVRRLLKTRLPQWIVWNLLPRIVGDVNTRRLVRRFRHSSLNRKPAARTNIDPALRRRLEDYYSDDVEQLGRLLGRDLMSLWWEREAERAA